MDIRRITDTNGLEIIEEKQERKHFEIAKGQNNRNYVKKETVANNILHIVPGNEKTGIHVTSLNFPIEYTCNHSCECYKESKCYAESGCYLFANNQAGYSENYNFYKACDKETFIKAVQLGIDYYGNKLFRYFTCGDIPNYAFIDCMVELAKNNPDIMFWTYTKKYHLVNLWLDCNGDLPENLTIIFSHWLNENGTYFKMDNPHDLPTSEFIPYGREELKETVDYICPCSDPSVIATCETCEHACYKLKKGQKQALLEHSTVATKERDKAVKTAKKALKSSK